MKHNKYFKCRNNTYYTKYSKEEIYTQINNGDAQTIIPFLQEMDYPFIETVWEKKVEFSPNSKILGRYIALMRLPTYKSFGFADSVWLNHYNRGAKK